MIMVRVNARDARTACTIVERQLSRDAGGNTPLGRATYKVETVRLVPSMPDASVHMFQTATGHLAQYLSTFEVTVSRGNRS